MIGTRLGPYEITARLGEGGMGEVYRARDSRLERDVAIKVLPAAFVEDHERLQRFEREAKLLAQLNHPNIAHIYGMEASGESHALVMELVEGPTLAERLEQGALSLEETLSLARQIAEALEEAHEKGIVHRDLKPQNIKASAEGKVKVLDFGLAKAMGLTGVASGAGSASQLAHSPTLTAGATVQGMILGTAAYMAPEQARAGAVDRRADVWAFGVVLFEMLTGKSLFAADTVPDTLARVLTRDVDLAELPGTVPPAIRTLLRRCLVRSPKDRLHSIADARIVIDDVLAGGADDLAPAEASPARPVWRPLVLGLVVGAALGAAALWLARPAAEAAAPLAFEKLTYRRGSITGARFAPDGQTFVYSAAWDGRPPDLFLGRIGSPDARSLGLEGAALLAVSSQGELAISRDWHREIGYEGVGTLATVPLEGGAPRELADGVLAADWAPDGRALAVSRFAAGVCRLEYPLGTVLATTTGWISDVRVHADGVRVAFVDHASRGENLGVVSVVGADRQVRVLSPQVFLYGIDWSPDGREVWAALGGGTLEAYAVAGGSRRLWSQPGQTRIDDVAADGRMLLAATATRREIVVHDRAAGTERSLGWFDWSFLEELSADGSTLLFDEQHLSSEGGYAIFLRRIDGSPAIRLGEGRGLSLSADGRWALAFHDFFAERPKLALIPTGAGTTRELPDDGIRYQGWARFAAGDTAVLVSGTRGDDEMQVFVRSLDGTTPARQVTENGTRLTLFAMPISPQGDRVALPEPDGSIRLYPLAGGAPTTVPGTRPDDEPLAFSPDGRALLVVDPRTMPLAIESLDLSTGERRPWGAVALADPAGVARLGPVALSADGKVVAASYIRSLDELHLAAGLR